MSRTRSRSSPSSLSAALQPFTLQLAVASIKPPPYSRSPPSSPTRNRSKKLSKSRSTNSSTSVTTDSSSFIYPFVPLEAPTVIPSRKAIALPVFVKYQMHSRPSFDSDEDGEDDREGVVYSRKSSTCSLRTRLMTNKVNGCEPKGITTTPGLLGAGETETESEDHLRHLPTSRIVPSSGPLIPPNTLQQSLTPLLFEFSRWLSIFPALSGAIYNIFCLHSPPSEPTISRADYAIAALWAMLTGYQCLALTTGLLRRWRVYYTPLPTLIRLLALQSICWPATQITLTVLDVRQRPATCWALIATTTCCSRSIQMWVTSNIIENEKSEYVSLRKWGGRKWDWGLVGYNCGLPAAVLYFIWTWVLVIRQELYGC